MSVRAKFRCAYKSVSGTTAVYRFDAAIDSENATWAKYTPSGSLNMVVDQDNTAASFEEGALYYLDVTPCAVTP